MSRPRLGTRGARHEVVASFELCVALACPNCATALEVRASLFDDRFWVYLSYAALPLALIGAIAVMLYGIGQPTPAGNTRPDLRERKA
jgi:hypothetical protein